jgi:D-glycero-D-manno-heptose 1,7-bisphosphate phosphatase
MSGQGRKAVFLDRDGTLNESPGAGWVLHPDELRIISGVPEALKRLSEAGYLLVIVTNQRGVALGKLTLETLTLIHEKLVDSLEKEGVVIVDIRFCPHGEEDNCDCRKPKPGMLLSAAEDLNIDLERSWMIGDQERDARTAIAAGVRPLLLSSAPMDEIVLDVGRISVFKGLPDAVDFILRNG